MGSICISTRMCTVYARGLKEKPCLTLMAVDFSLAAEFACSAQMRPLMSAIK